MDRRREGNRSERHRASQVGNDEDRPPRQTIDPHTGRQREEQERQEVDRSQRRHLERRRVEHHHGDQGQSDLADVRAELADRLGRPQLQEIGMAPEAAAWPESHQLAGS